MSCNGCRVLRKGCSDSCILRTSLQWIDSSESQGHATVFVAKFFGRAGMISFINAVSESQRPALFQSLLYEACGRTVSPVFGAVGLLWSGKWSVCQAAVETVLKGGTLKPTAQCLPSINPTSKPPPMAPCIYNTTNQVESPPSKPSIIHPESTSQIESHNKMMPASTTTTNPTSNANATTSTPPPPLAAAAPIACETPPSHPTLLMKRPHMLPITFTTTTPPPLPTTTTTTTTPLPPPKRPKSCPSRPGSGPECVDTPLVNGIAPMIHRTFEQEQDPRPSPNPNQNPNLNLNPIGGDGGGGGQLIAPIPRRVRVLTTMMPMVKQQPEPATAAATVVSSSCETPLTSYEEEDMEIVSTMHTVVVSESMSKEKLQGRVELNLSLNNFHGGLMMMRSKVYNNNSHGGAGSSSPHDEGQNNNNNNRVASPLTGMNRVSSPCSFSVTSDGSSLTSLDSVEFSMASSCWRSQQQHQHQEEEEEEEEEEGLHLLHHHHHHHHHHHLQERQLLNLL